MVCTCMYIDVTNTNMFGKVYNWRVLTKFLIMVGSDIENREWDLGIEGEVEVFLVYMYMKDISSCNSKWTYMFVKIFFVVFLHLK